MILNLVSGCCGRSWGAAGRRSSSRGGICRRVLGRRRRIILTFNAFLFLLLSCSAVGRSITSSQIIDPSNLLAATAAGGRGSRAGKQTDRSIQEGTERQIVASPMRIPVPRLPAARPPKVMIRALRQRSFVASLGLTSILPSFLIRSLYLSNEFDPGFDSIPRRGGHTASPSPGLLKEIREGWKLPESSNNYFVSTMSSAVRFDPEHHRSLHQTRRPPR